MRRFCLSLQTLRNTDYVHHARREAEQDHDDHQPRPGIQQTVQPPANNRAKTDADNKFDRNPQPLPHRLTALPRVGFWRISGFRLAQSPVNFTGACSEGLPILGAYDASAGALLFIAV